MLFQSAMKMRGFREPNKSPECGERSYKVRQARKSLENFASRLL
jgi:hypothetical protein